MSLFYLTVRNDEDNPREIRTWLVIAESETAARSLLPHTALVESISVRGSVKGGPARLIGWMTPSVPCPA